MWWRSPLRSANHRPKRPSCPGCKPERRNTDYQGPRWESDFGTGSSGPTLARIPSTRDCWRRAWIAEAVLLLHFFLLFSILHLSAGQRAVIENLGRCEGGGPG